MKSPLLGAGAILCASLAGCTVTVDSQSQIVREEKRFTVSGEAELQLTTFDGSIAIRAWDKPDIVVEVEKRGATREAVDGLEIKTDQRGNVVELEVKAPRSESFSGIGFHRSTTAKLTVSVPARTHIRARTGDGAVEIEGVSGRVDVRTGDGSITARQVAGELTLSTGDGSVTVDGASGKLDLDTGDGGISVTGTLDTVKMHSGDGAIVYRAEAGSTMAGPWDITTGDGSVTLYLPREFSAELDAYTGDGSIRNDIEVLTADDVRDLAIEKSDSEQAPRVERERSRREDREPKRTLRGRLGAGGPPLRIRTGDGIIRLRVS